MRKYFYSFSRHRKEAQNERKRRGKCWSKHTLHVSSEIIIRKTLYTLLASNSLSLKPSDLASDHP